MSNFPSPSSVWEHVSDSSSFVRTNVSSTVGVGGPGAGICNSWTPRLGRRDGLYDEGGGGGRRIPPFSYRLSVRTWKWCNFWGFSAWDTLCLLSCCFSFVPQRCCCCSPAVLFSTCLTKLTLLKKNKKATFSCWTQTSRSVRFVLRMWTCVFVSASFARGFLTADLNQQLLSSLSEHFPLLRFN